MDVQIEPRQLAGTVTPPPSKSMAHRLLIAAALAEGDSTIHNLVLSKDIEATLQCIQAIGGGWQMYHDGSIYVNGVGGCQGWKGELPRMDCGESGSTLRFFIPIALAMTGGGVFTGQGRLMERPQQPYFKLFKEKGIDYELSGNTLTVRGTLTPGDYRLPGNVSSQFFSGLLMALPLLDGPSTLLSTTEIESAAYITMTMGVLEQVYASVRFLPKKRLFQINPASYRPFDLTVEADWSQGAFWYAAMTLGSRVQIRGLSPDSYQGDKAVMFHARTLGEPGDATIDVSNCPDLLPPLAVMAAVRRGTTHFVHAARLRMKESDRLSSVAAMLEALGGQVQEEPEGLTVRGVEELSGGTVDGAGDHRVVMAAAIAATRCVCPVTILGAEAVKKSYPGFWDHFEQLGGVVHVL